MNTPLVSIIIPTYNRAHLIGETLDSILAQTYTNWECIVVDDGSSDGTDSLMQEYLQNDSRILYFYRPEEHLPGGCGARNYGLSRVQGDYVVFFDSDDLMTADHVEVKVNALRKADYDYVITKTKYFDALDPWIEKKYEGLLEGITKKGYINQSINWLTPDGCIKADLAKSIQFNEDLRSGQEYNYYTKLVLKSTKGKFIENYVTLRRDHDHSIRAGIPDRNDVFLSAYISCWVTYVDIKEKASNHLKRFLLMRCVNMEYKNRDVTYPYQGAMAKAIFKEFGVWSGINFLLMRFFNRHFNKGYRFRAPLVKKLATHQETEIV